MKTTQSKAKAKSIPSLSEIPVPVSEAVTQSAPPETAAPETAAAVADEPETAVFIRPAIRADVAGATGSGSNAETITQAVQRAASLAGRVAARNRASADQQEKTTGNSKRSVTTVKFTGDGLNESERNALALLKAVALVEKLTGAKLHLALSGK